MLSRPQLNINLKQLFAGKHKDISAEISGHEDINFTSTLYNEQPVHTLLVGKPGLGKTQFLEAIEREYEDMIVGLLE